MLRITFTTESKINVIRIIREIASIPLREAKDMVEHGAVMDGEQVEPFLSQLNARIEQLNQSNQCIHKTACHYAINTYIRPIGPVELSRSTVLAPY